MAFTYNIIKRYGVPLVGAAMCLEVICRFLHFVPQELDRNRGWIIAEGVAIARTEGSGTSHWLKGGIRRPASNQTKGVPLVIYGDSFTEALQVNDDEVYSDRLYSHLLKRGVYATISNFGRSGASVADYIDAGRNVPPQLQPTWTIVQIGDLDLMGEAWDEVGARFEFASNSLKVHRARTINASQRSWYWHSGHFLRNHSALVANSIRRYGEFREAWSKSPRIFNATSRSATVNKPSVERYPIEKILDELVRTFDGRITILWTTPHFSLSDGRKPSEIDLRAKRFLEQNNISFIDASEIYEVSAGRGVALSGFSNTQPFVGHWNSVGHEKIAQRLADELIARLP